MKKISKILYIVVFFAALSIIISFLCDRVWGKKL